MVAGKARENKSRKQREVRREGERKCTGIQWSEHAL
jgi:hypothetical protein